MLVCYECGKGIRRGLVQHTQPSQLSRLLGDFDKAYHPVCYEQAEQEAAKELGVDLRVAQAVR